ncbi:transposase [Leptothermofonsia sp. ETS-13]|uniref:transposase n=1 Tax=Leptothermofonsia sp. ETS-13 TaxID=3035696 RepID=UPI003BA0CFF8
MSHLAEIEPPPLRQPHPSDLSDAAWQLIQPLLPQPKGFGHPRTVNLREILNAIFITASEQGVSGRYCLMIVRLTPQSIVISLNGNAKAFAGHS